MALVDQLTRDMQCVLHTNRWFVYHACVNFDLQRTLNDQLVAYRRNVSSFDRTNGRIAKPRQRQTALKTTAVLLQHLVVAHGQRSEQQRDENLAALQTPNCHQNGHHQT